MPGDERSWQLAHKAAAAKDARISRISGRQDIRIHTQENQLRWTECEDNGNDCVMTKKKVWDTKWIA